MSGGSFDYLCYKEASDLLSGSMDEQIERMRDALVEAGAEDAAKETEHLLLVLKQSRVRVGVALQRLHGVWHAMEWWKSSDWGRKDFEEVLAMYRGEK
jgi:hypothetical protein